MATIDSKKFILRFHLSELIGILIGVPLGTAYALLLVSFEPDVVKVFLQAIGMATVVIVLFMALPTDHLLMKNLAHQLDGFRNGTLSRKEIQNLFDRLNRLPYLHGGWIFIRIALGSTAIALYGFWELEIDVIKTISILSLAFYGGFISGLIAFMYVFNLIRKPCEELVAEGEIADLLVKKRKFYGLSFFWKAMIFLVLPAFYANFSIFLFFASSVHDSPPIRILLPKLTGLVIVNLLTMSAAIFLVVYTVSRRLHLLSRSLERFVSDSGDQGRTIPTSLSDDFDYISFLINQSVGKFRDLLVKVNSSTGTLFDATMNLTSTSGQVFTTANHQAASVKEIVTTMEDSERHAREIGEQIEGVAKIAGKTREDVEEGVAIIGRNREKMEEIKKTNAQTLEGIRSLTESIRSIWEIVNIITGIASQTRIIAFNAELEASAAGEDGKNFEIVASEVRRLADDTVESTDEIKEKIAQIQKAFDGLILSSEQETAKVQEGWALSGEQEGVYRKILTSAEGSKGAAERISEAARQQISAFEQILLTLKQISEGIDSFVDATSGTNRSAEDINQIAEDLNGLLKGSLQ